MSVYDEIKAERDRQDKQWGGSDHDDHHSRQDWRNYIVEFAKDLRGRGNFRHQMVCIAALAVAAIESYDRQRKRRRVDDDPA